MAADTLKSRSITNVDSNPIIYDSAGFNIATRELTATDYATVTTGGLGSTSSLYYLVRMRSNSILRSVKLFVSTQLDTNASKTLTFDIGAYYSDSTMDGTQAQLQGTQISANAIAAAVASPPNAGVAGSVEFYSAPPAAMDKMLWDFLGLASDPGGYIDLVVAVHAVAATAAAGDLGMLVTFCEH